MIIATGVILFCALTVWALCRAASRGDKALAEAFERHSKKDE